MIFELTQNFHDAVTAMPKEHPKYRMPDLLEEGIRRDILFTARHPTTLFQCMWNSLRVLNVSTIFTRGHDGTDFRWLRLEMTTFLGTQASTIQGNTFHLLVEGSE